jgi:hypothetical protein
MKAKINSLDEPKFALDSSILAQINQSPQEIEAFRGSYAIAPCPACGSTKVKVVKMANYCHYGAVHCGECETFLKWQAKPKNIKTRQQQQQAINQLLKSPQLSQWERTFLEGVKGKKISPKQQEVLAWLEAKVGEQG